MGASLEGDEKLLEPDNGDSCMTTKVLKPLKLLHSVNYILINERNPTKQKTDVNILSEKVTFQNKQ